MVIKPSIGDSVKFLSKNKIEIVFKITCRCAFAKFYWFLSEVSLKVLS